MQKFEQAVSLQAAGQLNEARIIYSEILKEDPTHFSSLMNLGAISFTTRQLDTAVQCYSIANKLDPASAEALYNRGCARHVQGELAGAESDYRQCLHLQPDHQACLENLITILHTAQRDLSELKTLLLQRLAISAEADYFLLLGNTCKEMGDTEEAVAAYEATLNINPLDPAADYFLRTRALQHQTPRLHELSSRWSVATFAAENPARIVPLPMWDGSALKNKSLYVSAEQGLGDQAMFASALDQLDAGKITWEIEPRLVNALSRRYPDINVIPAGRDITELHDIDWQSHDVYCPAADLPGIHDVNEPQYPTGPWLAPDPASAVQWQTWLDTMPGLKVGLSWQGGSNSAEIDKHSVPLTGLAPLFQCSNTRFISVQYDVDNNEVARLHKQIEGELLLPPDIDCRSDVDELLALLSRLDLVITIDNATAYLAAAAGTPVWILLPTACDWRWQAGGRWQQGITRFHQSAKGDWTTTVDQLALALLEYRAPASRDIAPCKIKTPAQQRRRPRVLVLNDALNHRHWGYALASLSLHQLCQQHGYATDSFPVAGVALNEGLAPALHEFDREAHWQQLLDRNPELAGALARSEKIIVDGEVANDNALLLYLAYGVKRFYGKPVIYINHRVFNEPPEHALLDLLKPVYQAFDHVISADQLNQDIVNLAGTSGCQACNLLPVGLSGLRQEIAQPPEANLILLTAGDNTTIDYADALIELIQDSGHAWRFQFLTGSRSQLNPEDIALMQVLQAKLPGRVDVLRAGSEIEWLQYLKQAACVITTQQHHLQASQMLGISVVAPEGATGDLTLRQALLQATEQPAPSLTTEWLKQSASNRATIGEFLNRI